MLNYVISLKNNGEAIPFLNLKLKCCNIGQAVAQITAIYMLNIVQFVMASRHQIMGTMQKMYRSQISESLL